MTQSLSEDMGVFLQILTWTMRGREHQNLRARLRRGTRSYHEELDELVSRFDLAEPQGLVGFLTMQACIFGAMSSVAGRAASCGVIADLCQRALTDLDKMSAQTDVRCRFDRPLHPIAIDYVVLGSRLGTQVLKKRWQLGRQNIVEEANTYFSAPTYIDLWKSFCADTRAMASNGPLADQIILDTNDIFQKYLECARELQSPQGAIHA